MKMNDSIAYRCISGQLEDHQTVPFLNAVGMTIDDIVFNTNALVIHLREDGKAPTQLSMRDRKRSCCESRFLRTDDDVSEHIGATFVDVVMKESTSARTESGMSEATFLEIVTSRGCFVLSAHNEHNGYYGGFDLCIVITGGRVGDFHL